MSENIIKKNRQRAKGQERKRKYLNMKKLKMSAELNATKRNITFLVSFYWYVPRVCSEVMTGCQAEFTGSL